MITDAIIGALHAAVVFLVELLPLAPARPGYIDAMVRLAYQVDYLIPASEIIAFLPTIAIVWGAFALWRLVRFLWIGGG
jgi:hypothetical protein